jgi:hypothetical protein
MMDNFEKLYESANKTLRQTKIFRYPKQIQLSEEFIQALEKEVKAHTEILDEDNHQPIRNFSEKFLKALKFEVSELTRKK